MLLDKSTVETLLDKKCDSYDGNLLAIKLLPENALFEIVVEEIVTAEYYDSDKDEYFRFELGYDYFSYGKEISEGHKRNLDLSINLNLTEQESQSKEEYKKNGKAFNWVLVSFIVLLTLFALSYAYLYYAV